MSGSSPLQRAAVVFFQRSSENLEFESASTERVKSAAVIIILIIIAIILIIIAIIRIIAIILIIIAIIIIMFINWPYLGAPPQSGRTPLHKTTERMNAAATSWHEPRRSTRATETDALSRLPCCTVQALSLSTSALLVHGASALC